MHRGPSAVMETIGTSGLPNEPTVQRTADASAAGSLASRAAHSRPAPLTAFMPGGTTLVIPTLDRPADLERCLRSIGRLRRGFDQIVVVDQGDPGTTERAAAKAGDGCGPDVTIVPLAVRSAAAARNAGIEEAVGEFVFFIDDDVELDEGYVENALDCFERRPEVVAVTGYIDETRARPRWLRLVKRLLGALLLVAPLGPGISRAGGAAPPVFRTPRRWLQDVQFLPGGHFACRRKVFDEGFRFEPGFILGSFGEDRMFSRQVHRHYGPGSFAFVPGFSLRHHASPERSPDSEAAVRMHVIYRFIFWRREVYGGSALNALCWLYAQLGFFLFLLKRFRRTPLRAARAALQSYRWLLAHHREVADDRIDYNRFVVEGPP